MNNLHMTIVCKAILLITKTNYFAKCFLVDGYFTCWCCQSLDSGSILPLELSAVAQKAIVIPRIACDSFFCGWQKIKL